MFVPQPSSASALAVNVELQDSRASTPLQLSRNDGRDDRVREQRGLSKEHMARPMYPKCPDTASWPAPIFNEVLASSVSPEQSHRPRRSNIPRSL